MQAARQKKRTTAPQPAWDEWVAKAGANATDPASIHEAIANLAYSYWDARGRQGGSAEDDWLRAEEKMKRHGMLDPLN